MDQNLKTHKTDIVYHGWIARMPQVIRPYLILMRADRPIGTWLLLFPCWWTLSLASTAGPDLYYAFLFAVGSFVMRGAGCVMNDLADRNFDGQVARTATRPIPNGDVTPIQAVVFMLGLCLIGLGVLLQFNFFTVILASLSLGLVFIYPFCKRWTYWPQVILGLTFNWGALVGWSAVKAELSFAAICVYLAGLFWTLGYDTIYAHQDKEDDILVGIKSTALRLGDKTIPALWLFYGLSVGLLCIAGFFAQAGYLYYGGLCAAAMHLIWQIRNVNIHDAQNCLQMFKSNKNFGWLVLLACLLGNVGL